MSGPVLQKPVPHPNPPPQGGRGPVSLFIEVVPERLPSPSPFAGEGGGGGLSAWRGDREGAQA
jgi:hypothetical protein